MVIFNTFSNGKRYNDMPETDIIIWCASLIRYKGFGYKTKIFCLESDLEFLKHYHLFELYDEIDTTLLKDNEQLSKIDESIFWSSRKIEAMYHQLFTLNEPSIYVDTDILMRKPYDLSGDCLVWSPETRIIVELPNGEIDWTKTIYPSWKFLSKPEGYVMPDYIKQTPDAYNCGVWFFKNKEVFKKYREEYYKFCIGNPGIIKHSKNKVFNNAMFPCNAEQRILKAVLTEENQKVNCVMPIKAKGLCEKGMHYFWYRVSWRKMKEKNVVPTQDSLSVLNYTLIECMMTLKRYNYIYEFYSNLPWLKDFETQFKQSKDKIIIRRYN